MREIIKRECGRGRDAFGEVCLITIFAAFVENGVYLKVAVVFKYADGCWKDVCGIEIHFLGMSEFTQWTLYHINFPTSMWDYYPLFPNLLSPIVERCLLARCVQNGGK